MCTRRRILVCLLILGTASWLDAQDSIGAPGVSAPKAVNVLFLGNSLSEYNDGVYFHIQKLAESASPPIVMQETHLMYPDANLTTILRRGGALRQIRSHKYDVVVLREGMSITTVEHFTATCELFVREIHQVNARAILFMHWDAPRSPIHDWIGMEEIAKANYRAAELFEAEVSPVGLAWKAAERLRPDVRLYRSDNLHPTKEGTYLAACALFITIFKQTPVRLPYTGEIDPATAEALQDIAWRTATNTESEH